MKNTTIILIIILLSLVGFIIYGSFKTENSIKEIKADVFTGKITNINLSPGNYSGTGAYDRTCRPVESGLTQCDGGIQIEQGIINFEYKHNMMEQGCIDVGQNFNVEVFADGTAKVTRI